MTIPLTGTGGFFTRVGRMGAIVRAVNLFRGTGSLLIATIQRTANVATVTTAEKHSFTTGDTMMILGVTSDVVFNVASATITVTTTTAFTYANVAANAGPFFNQGHAIKIGGVGYFAVGPMIDNLEAQFQSFPDQNLADGIYRNRDDYRRVHGSFLGTMRLLARNTLIQMANDDVLLTSPQLPLAMTTLIAQMTVSADSVTKPTISITATAGGSNNGDGVCIASVLGGNGKQRDYIFAENIDLLCTADSQSGAALGSESFSAAGDAAQFDTLNWDWPTGSGTNTGLGAIDANSTAQNLLTNGDFEKFTVANTPDSWIIDPASAGAGTDIFKETVIVYSKLACLRFTGTGAVPLTGIYQTQTALKPDTVYAVNVWLRKSAGLIAGVLELDLHNGTTVINDDQAVANALSVAFNATGLSSASWKAFNAFFRTPKIMPATVRFRVKVTTALTNSESFLIDRLSFMPATELYIGGPFASIFSGATKFIIGDTFTLAVSNAYDSRWQLLVEKLFGMRSLGQQLPSSGAPTIADSLIG